MSALDSIPWEWVGAFGGLACTGLCGFIAVVGIGIAVWRLRAKKPPEPEPELPSQGPETERILTTVLGYRRVDAHKRSRERWGRPVSFTRTESAGAAWSTPVDGATFALTEREGKPGGLQTGTASLDSRFHITSDHPEAPRWLAEPELRDRLLALPWAHITCDGARLSFTDTRLKAHQKACTPHPPESADGLAMQVRLHDGVCDVLVMLADRLG